MGGLYDGRGDSQLPAAEAVNAAGIFSGRGRGVR
jgi:hypothetical protein